MLVKLISLMFEFKVVLVIFIAHNLDIFMKLEHLFGHMKNRFESSQVRTRVYQCHKKSHH